MAASRKTKTSGKPTAKSSKKSASGKASPSRAQSSRKPTAKARAAKPAVAKKTAKVEKAIMPRVSRKTSSDAPAKTKPARAAKPAAPAKPPKPEKSAVDPELLKTIREALVGQRNQLLSVVQATQAQLAEKETGLADLSDRASDGFEDELALGLMRIEAAQIEDIEAAIRRIDDGSYGLCVDCGKSIPRKRLEVLPFAQRCLDCEGTKERRARMQTGSDDDGDGSGLD